MFFGWLRSQVRAAVLGGIADAVAEIDTDGQTVTPDVLQALQARLRPALPAPETADQAEGKPGRKRASVA